MKRKYQFLELETISYLDVVTTSGFDTEDDDFGDEEGGGAETPIVPTANSDLFNI